MADEREACVQVSLHAVLRWRERGGTGHDGFEILRQLAEDAIRNGRKAKRVPRWACRDDRRFRSQHRQKRYLWTEDERFCLVAILQKKCWTILTVIASNSQ